MPSEALRSPGRVPVALYIASADGDPDGVLENHCRQYAETREWVVAASFTDALMLPALDERSGWQSISAVLSAGEAQGIVTWTRSMVAESADEWGHLTVLMADRGWFLAAGALDTPGQPLYSGGPRHYSQGRPPRQRQRAAPRSEGQRSRSQAGKEESEQGSRPC